MVAEAAKQNIKPKDDAELVKATPRLKLQLKALVARDLWDMSQSFAVINVSNHIVMKAVELLGVK